jgi:hypothetical protein
MGGRYTMKRNRLMAILNILPFLFISVPAVVNAETEREQVERFERTAERLERQDTISRPERDDGARMVDKEHMGERSHADPALEGRQRDAVDRIENELRTKPEP